MIYLHAFLFAILSTLGVAGIAGFAFFFTKDSRKTALITVIGMIPVIGIVFFLEAALLRTGC